MRPQKVEKDELLERMMAVIRAKGYDGASLSELAKAAGLQKASLYHRYPGGKKDIALGVLNFIGDWVQKHVFDILENSNENPKKRISMATENIRKLYHEGEAICIVRALALEGSLELFGSELKQSIEKWIFSFQTLGMEMGLSEEEANRKAMKAIISIQGSLVVSKALGSTKPFLKVMDDLENEYLELG